MTLLLIILTTLLIFICIKYKDYFWAKTYPIFQYIKIKLLNNKKTILFFIALVFIAHGFLAFSILGEEEVRITTPDEEHFIIVANDLFTRIMSRDLKSILDFGLAFGYGYIFWLICAVIIGPLKFIGFSAQIFVGRLICLIFFSITLFFVYKIISLYQRKELALLGAFSVLLLPAFAFFGKIFSVEYFSCAAIICFLYYLLSDKGLFKKRFYFAVFIIGIAIGLKLNAVFCLVSLPVYLISYRQRNIKNMLLILTTMTICIVIGFLASNFAVIFSDSARKILTELIPRPLDFNTSMFKLAQWYYIDSFTWDDIPLLGIHESLGRRFGETIFTIYILIAIITNIRQKNRLTAIFILLSVFFTFVFGIGTRCYFLHTWYMFPAFLVILILPFLIGFKNQNVNTALILIFSTLLSISNIPKIAQIYNHKLIQIKTIKKKKESTKLLESFFSNVEPGRVVVSTEVVLIGDRLSLGKKGLSHLMVYKGLETHYALYDFSPDFFKKYPDTEYIIYEKNTGVLKELSDYKLPSKYDWYFPTNHPARPEAKAHWKHLLTDGIAIDGVKYRFTPVFETETEIIYKKL